MERAQFERLRTQVTAATARQILELEDVIQCISAPIFIQMALARRTRLTLRAKTCPYCEGKNIVRHGNDQNGRQRFKCRGCRRTYNILTGTPMARARKPEKWATYLGCMTEHMSVREIVASGIGVHQVTAWRWRHRFLKAAANGNAAVLSGVIEANETFFPRSFKGSRRRKRGGLLGNCAADPGASTATKRRLSPEQVPVLSALDSSGGVFERVLPSLTDIEAALAGRIAAGSLLCSGACLAYRRVADAAGAEHYVVSVPAISSHAVTINSPLPGRLRLGRVNDHHRRLRHLIDERCRGVATKYLGHYLGWNRAMTRSGFEGKALLDLALA